MKITKNTLSNNIKPTQTLNVISKINYIQIENCEKFNSLCLSIAENLTQYCKSKAVKLAENPVGTLIAVNEMSVSYFDGEIISLKCDFTVSQSTVLLYHRRYAVNYLLSRDMMLLSEFVKGVGRRRSDTFFLINQNEKLYAVPIAKKSADTPIKLGRKSELDRYCNGRAKETKIKLPHCFTARKLVM